ncbi:MAG TPA: NUDIX domain-containing protein [Candidatus Saccharimonadales bacterium]|nr:NUDIX domain-containing protein [Candidatus Saccharimonadales bacterium]
MSSDRPKVGIGLLLIKDGKYILLGKRKSSHGDGEYAGVGGHMEHLETVNETIMRELQEEIGDDIRISTPQFLCLSNIRDYAPKHYIDVGLVAEWISGEPKVMEPDKIESWDWYPLDAIPEPLFASCKHYLAAYRTGTVFFENS